MTDWPPGRGNAVRPAVFPAPEAPLAGPNSPGAGTAREAARWGAAGAAPMVADGWEPAEQPAASRQAPAASKTACAAARRRPEIREKVRGTGAFMPMGRRRGQGGSHGKVTTWQLLARGSDLRLARRLRSDPRDPRWTVLSVGSAQFSPPSCGGSSPGMHTRAPEVPP